MAGYFSKDPYGKSDTASNENTDTNEGKLFVGGLAWDSTEESIKQYFETFGPVESVNLKRNKEDASKHRGFAFVKFTNGADAERVLSQKEPHIIDGSRVDPKSACPLGIKPEQRTKKIFVGGLQAETTEEKLMEYFGQFGEIKNNIEFAVDHNTKKRRGFCFIEFASEGIVDRIVKEKFHEVAGKRLETKRALTKQQQQEASAVTGFDGLRRGRLPNSVVYGGMPIAAGATPYAQPVIYIHPDSLSTTYPLSAVGMTGLTAYPGITPSYTSALETLYTPYSSRDSRHGAAPSPRGAPVRHDPYRSAKY
ncbi:heterogeneous nuclear ribonucleoprotein A/B-like [Hydractinia symbiolongicarpus]|uniref:heterogeneous nuclear ribonucleoprotein A/B-like n=1 Tax=Hydractinia symbiolongicarpus TaxID=13093 RepID=UPI00254F11FD|nr:heterogeneous nuclear ribonucleoprotein A/B-like [Hydractinia symbiolongicarpus]XP_057310323.1 heterogeneous nuclear ribonucleoprotein A/B-like [Hydractinia symbiolongicarpus]